MDLNSIIPKKYKHLDSWKIKSNTLLFKNYQYIPICYIGDDNTIYIYLDLKVKKQIIELTKELLNKNYKFFFTTPELSNPSGVIELENTVIRNYLLLYANSFFYKNFNKINFDIIQNMVNWANENDCYDLIKEELDFVIKKYIDSKDYDYYRNTYIYRYSEEIRDEYRTIYRQIQINQLLH